MSPSAAFGPEECVALLEEAQCGEAADADRACRAVAARSARPHAAIALAALQLLEVHPMAVTPHIPDLVSAEGSEVSAAVEAFALALRADRALLVPVVAALGELPLGAAHRVQTRATLAFALEVVDDADVPAIVRALVRTYATTKTLAKWAAVVLRKGLVRPLAGDAGYVVGMVLSEVGRGRGAVGRALREDAGKRVLVWVDFVIWVTTLHRAGGAAASAWAEVADGIRASYRSGVLLSGPFDMLSRTLLRAARPLEQMPEGVRRFVYILIDTIQSDVYGVEESAALVHLVCAILRLCPAATNGIVSDLSSSARRDGAGLSEAVLMGLVGTVPCRALQAGSGFPHPSASVAVSVALHATRASADSGLPDRGAWPELFVKIRKGLLFGANSDRANAIALARDIVLRADDIRIVRELISIMDTSISKSPSDELAVSFLAIIGLAIIRDAIDCDLAAILWEGRIETAVPSGLLAIEYKSSDDAVGVAPFTLKVDVGVIHDQPPSAIAVLVSAAVVFVMKMRGVVNESAGALEVVVLVPVVCLPLYQAAEELYEQQVAQTLGTASPSSDAASVRTRQTRSGAVEANHIVEMQRMSDADLRSSITSFAAGISAMTGILNLACVSLSAAKSILCLRHDPAERHAAAHRSEKWALLERVTELDRMRRSLILAVDVYEESVDKRGKTHDDNVDDESDSCEEFEDGRKRGAVQRGNLPKELRALISAVRRVHGPCCSAGKNIGDASVTGGDEEEPLNALFPGLSIEATVSALIAIPDERGIDCLAHGTTFTRKRDPELALIDDLLLRRLVLVLHEARKRKQPGGRKRARPRTERTDTGGGANISENVTGEVKSDSACDARTGLLDNDEDLFYGGESEDDAAVFGGQGHGAEETTLWSNEMPQSTLYRQPLYGSRSAVYLGARKTIGDAFPSQDVSEIVCSPAFAALLLDRAVTYVAVAAQTRQEMSYESDDLNVLATANSVAGMALRCFTSILQLAARLYISSANGEASHSLQDISQFIAELDSKLLASVARRPETSVASAVSSCVDDDGHETKTVSLLQWIVRSSVDVAVATVALDAVLVLAEVGCAHSGDARQLVLSGLTRIYEYDGDKLWQAGDLPVLLPECLLFWSIRRRKGGYSPVQHDGLRDTVAETGPWMHVGWKRWRSSSWAMEQYRLLSFFGGMYLPDAVTEACGWVRQISLVLFQNAAPATTSKEKRADPNRFVARVTEAAASTLVDADTVSQTRECECLIDMFGAPPLIDLLMQVASVALDEFVIADTMPVSAVTQPPPNPLSNLVSALNLLRGLIEMHSNYRAAAVLSSLALKRDSKRDKDRRIMEEIDYRVIVGVVAALQSTRSRIGEVMTWYSNPSTDTSDMTDTSMDTMVSLAGAAADASCAVSKLADAVKKGTAPVTPGGGGSRPNATGPGSKKRPGYVRARRKSVADAVPTTDGLSRSRRAIPRLLLNAEAVSKIALQLAKVIGVRVTKSLPAKAPLRPDLDSSLFLGSGIDSWRQRTDSQQLNADAAALPFESLARVTGKRRVPAKGNNNVDEGAEGNNSNGSDSMDESDEEFDERLDGRQGFHALSSDVNHESALEPETVVVRFR